MLVKLSQLKLGDVVHYTNAHYAFGDMEVVRCEDNGVYLRRPYITNGEAHFEELWWSKDSNFEFVLVETADYEDERWKRKAWRGPVSCSCTKGSVPSTLEKEMSKIKNLAVRLLDDEHGIDISAYTALLDIMSEAEALELNRQSKCQDSRFYLPEGHTLQAWRMET